MKTQHEIENFLSQQMHGTWQHLDHLSKLACTLAYAIGDRMGYEQGYNAGYDDGFQVGSAAERGIVAMQTKFDEIDNSTDHNAAQAPETPTSDLAHQTGAGSVHPIFRDILKTIAP